MNQAFLCGSIIACLCSILLINILYLKLCERIKLQIVRTCIEVDFMHMIATNLYKPILDLSDPDFRCLTFILIVKMKIYVMKVNGIQPQTVHSSLYLV